MTLTLDTYNSTGNRKESCKKHYTTFTTNPNPYFLLNYNIESDFESAFVVMSGESNIVTDFSEIELTALASESSESSFNELWKNEDDEYWDSYL